MIRTVVCEKEGCSGNTFFIETQGNNLVLTCEHCKSKYEFDISYYDFIIYENASLSYGKVNKIKKNVLCRMHKTLH